MSLTPEVDGPVLLVLLASTLLKDWKTEARARTYNIRFQLTARSKDATLARRQYGSVGHSSDILDLAL